MTAAAALLTIASTLLAGAAPVAAADPLVGAPAVGECRDYGPDELYSPHEESTPVDCGSDHTGLVVAVTVVPDEYALSATPDAQLGAYASKTCRSAWRRTIGASHAQAHQIVYRGAWFVPTESQLAQGARWLRCDVTALGGKDRLGDLPRATPFVDGAIDRGDRRCIDRKNYYVSCSQPHEWISRGIVTAPKGRYSEKAQDAFASRRCPSTLKRSSDSRYKWERVSKAAWKAGERHIVCFGNGR
jgi:hypothetical protein